MTFVLMVPFLLSAAEKPDKYGAYNVFHNSLLSTIGIANTGDDPLVIVNKIVNLILGFIGIVLFGLMLYAGFTWIKSRGNTNEVDRAKNIIENCLYGILIIVLAYGISEFIFNILIGLG